VLAGLLTQVPSARRKIDAAAPAQIGAGDFRREQALDEGCERLRSLEIEREEK
jgi:hypothetical protein